MASDKSTSVGRWRLKYGLASAAAVGLFGLLCVLASWLWLEPPLDEPAVIIAVFAFIFAAFVLGTTFAFSRWSDVTEYRCRNCQLSWIEEVEHE